MTVFPGTRLGPNEITDALGAGGMENVFPARAYPRGESPAHHAADPAGRETTAVPGRPR